MLYVNQPCECVAFRLDDVYDGSRANVSIQIIEVFEKKNIPLTLGLIGNGLDDTGVITEKIRSSLAEHGNLELANHSYEHKNHDVMNREEAEYSILTTNQVINRLYGVDATVFIPPRNLFNDVTVKILEEQGFTHMSAWLPTQIPALDPINGLAHIPSNAQFEIFNHGVVTPVPPTSVFKMIKAGIQNDNYAVVTIHPVAFYKQNADREILSDVDLQIFQNLDRLLSLIETDGLKVVHMSEIK